MEMHKVSKRKPRFRSDDFSHPYIDDYDMLRIDYIDWMKNYEKNLHKSIYFGYPKKIDLLEWLDETMDSYWGYYGLVGSDAVFSAEIYFYIKELLELQETIRC